ncbi:MAG: hypothetical protein L3J91_03430 [Thermoplasmata archaeon]|nr:hypothetical protein [Thermoplasmata archaeon]
MDKGIFWGRGHFTAPTEGFMEGTSRAPLMPLAILLVALFAVGTLVPSAAGSTPSSGSAAAGPARPHPPVALPPSTNLSYNSSVDGWPLSYLEWLPAGYSATRSYPLAVFLHGVGASSAWIRGGTGGMADMTPSLLDNASSSGFVFIALNTRTVDGFYIDSPCGGPQQQDVLDAIAHEEALRHIGPVYLVGFSMGSLGAFSIAGHFPGRFAGIATAGTITDKTIHELAEVLAGTITDIFETIAFNTASGLPPSGLYDAMCGAHPAPANASVDRVWASLSVLRFEPQNFSGIPLFVTGGGADPRAPNNFAKWDYANVNNTFVNSTCTVVTSLGEPPNCTVTIPSLAAGDPSAYRWLDLYEPTAPHSAQQLPGQAVFAFFLGEQRGGYYVGPYPGGALTPYTPGTPLPTTSPGASWAGEPFWLWAAIGGTGLAVGGAAVLLVRRGRS